MTTFKLSGIAVAMTSICMITSTTFANAQSIRKLANPSATSACASKTLNRGFIAEKPHKAVKGAYVLWNKLAKENGYKKFKFARDLEVTLLYLPDYNPANKGWKANVKGYPCK
jgi:hypothetical protein